MKSVTPTKQKTEYWFKLWVTESGKQIQALGKKVGNKSSKLGIGIQFEFEKYFPVVNFKHLEWMSKHFGTTEIDLDQFYEENCPTCRGSTILKGTVYKATKNNPFREEV